MGRYQEQFRIETLLGLLCVLVGFFLWKRDALFQEQKDSLNNKQQHSSQFNNGVSKTVSDVNVSASSETTKLLSIYI